MFTHSGLSGPTVLSASAHMGKPGAYQLVIDLKPALWRKLDARISRIWSCTKTVPWSMPLRICYPGP
ncbi:MAG: hypothetical protein ACLU9S_20025 [Oscillospiraceae bacterium]